MEFVKNLKPARRPSTLLRFRVLLGRCGMDRPRGRRLIRVRSFSNRSNRVCLGPERPGGADGVNSGFTPPCGFVTGSVRLAMMAAAQRDGEIVAHLAPKRTMLRKPNVMRIRRLAPTNQAGLLGHEFAVVLNERRPGSSSK